MSTDVHWAHDLKWQPPYSIPLSKVNEALRVLGIPTGLRVVGIRTDMDSITVIRLATDKDDKVVCSQGHVAKIETVIPLDVEG